MDDKEKYYLVLVGEPAQSFKVGYGIVVGGGNPPVVVQLSEDAFNYFFGTAKKTVKMLPENFVLFLTFLLGNESFEKLEGICAYLSLKFHKALYPKRS